MSKYWNDRVKNLDPYVPGEHPRNKRVIKLNTNENPYPPSPGVVEAIQRALSAGSTGGAGDQLRLYPDPGSLELREAAAERYGVHPDQVFPGNGSDEVLAFSFGTFFNSDAAAPVLFPDITYIFYQIYAGLWNIPFRAIPLGDDFSITGGDYLLPAAGVVFPNPNAPTGRAQSFEDMVRVVDFQHKRNRVVIVDEAYTAFGARSVVPLIRDYPNLLTIHTLSKMGSLAGLRVGFAIGHEELITGLCRIRDSFNSYPLDRLAQAGAAAALKDHAYYAGITQKIIATRERTAAAFSTLGFTVIPSQTNFLFVSPPQKPGDTVPRGAAFFTALRDRGILVRYFNKPRITDFVRISIGTDEDMAVLLKVCEELVSPAGPCAF
ncbi:MAG: aminotransferase class I/II-fold pyridoxal phosphate-dependent enzyme [Treponema sp.]|jgi:histidinol-phosphate aminotransferase|nr:aminotransferase class I/II-fold pyridoxal phosphate-dependent enzyme [Treponema sp.]